MLKKVPSFLWLCFLIACQASNDPTATTPTGNNNTTNNTSSTCKPTPPGRANTKKILFVGNSLTYTNNLPTLFAILAKQKGKMVETEMLASAGYALEDHWNVGCLQKLISSGYYDIVVLQQGPSSQTDGRTSLLEFGGRIHDLCLASNTELAFFMVWPAKINYATFSGVIASYTAAANATGSILCPVGLKWKQLMDSGDFSYYGPDDFHPSLAGSTSAAEIIYNSIFP